MTTLTHHAGRIERVEHAGTSRYGNPAYRFHFTDGRSPVQTQWNGSIGYEATNYQPGEWVRYGVTRHGRMVSIEHFDTSRA